MTAESSFDEFCRRIGCRVANRRRYRRLSVADLAATLEMNVETVQRLEAGRADVRISELWKVAESLDVVPATLIAPIGSGSSQYPEPEAMNAVMERVRAFVRNERNRDRRFGRQHLSELMRESGVPRSLAGKKLWKAAFENGICTKDELSVIWRAMDRIDQAAEGV